MLGNLSKTDEYSSYFKLCTVNIEFALLDEIFAIKVCFYKLPVWILKPPQQIKIGMNILQRNANDLFFYCLEISAFRSGLTLSWPFLYFWRNMLSKSAFQVLHFGPFWALSGGQIRNCDVKLVHTKIITLKAVHQT